MKKTIRIIFAVIILSVMVCTLAACGIIDSEGNVNIDKKPSPPPKNIRVENGNLVWDFDTAETLISWPTVIVKCNGKEITSKPNSKKVPLTDIVKESGTYVFSLVSKSGWLDDKLYIDSPQVMATIDIEVLSAPFDLKYDHTTRKISWDAVEKATGYDVFVNNNKFEVSTNEFVLNNASGTQSITVISKGDSKAQFDSLSSSELNLQFLETPTGLKFENNVLTWNPVENVSKYSIYINGQMHSNRIKPSCELKNLTGTVNLQVVACGNNVTIYDSPLSAAIQIIIQ